MLRKKKDRILKLAIFIGKRENRDVLDVYKDLKKSFYKMYNGYRVKNKK